VDNDGCLSVHEFAVLLRAWACLAQQRPLSVSSRYNFLRKACLSGGSIAYGTLICAPIVGKALIQTIVTSSPKIGANGFGAALGLAFFTGCCGVVFSLSHFLDEQALVVPTGDGDLRSIQPRSRVVACTTLALSTGVLVTPMWLLLHLFKSQDFPHTLWWQYSLSPAVALVGASGYLALRQACTHLTGRTEAIQGEVSTAASVIKHAPLGDTIAITLSGLGTAIALGGIAHCAGAPAIRNILVAPSLWRGAFASDFAHQKFFGRVDPASILFGDGLYALTTLGYGGLIAYHVAGASARYTLSCNTDHLHCALNVLLDVVAVSVRITQTVLTTTKEILKGIFRTELTKNK